MFRVDDAGRLATGASSPCAVEAVVLASPERVAAPPPSPFRAIPQGEKSQLAVRVTAVRDGDQWRNASGKCDIIIDGHLLTVGALDRIRVFGQWSQPAAASNPGQFDFALHSQADRQLLQVRCESPDCVSVVSANRSWRPTVWIDQLRNHWRSLLWRSLGEQRAPMASAMLLGARGAMPREAMHSYRVTGTLHILVVSGLHAGILISIAFTALGLGWLSRRKALVLAMILILAYTLLTGAHPPVIRAAVLAELACLALLIGVNPFALNSLAAAALVVLALNPADLFRTGPQLSFLCAGVLLWFSTVRWRRKRTPLDQLLHSVKPWYAKAGRRLGNSTCLVMGATLAVWLLSAPLLMQSYNLATPVAVLISPLLFPLVALTLFAGFAYLVAGWLVPIAEPTLATTCNWTVAALEALITHSSQLPGGYWWTPSLPAWWVLGWYALAAILLVPGGTRWGWQRALQLCMLWILVGSAPVLYNRSVTPPDKVAFLDVGHGVCVVLTTSEGSTVLYDAGSLGSPSYAAETISTYLWSRGIRTIDGIVLSHPDVDHFNALPGLAERFAIGQVFASPMMFPRSLAASDRSAPAELLRLLNQRDIPVSVVELGDRLTIDARTKAQVLYPDRLGNLASDNANSLVLAVELGGRRILLPGDLESPGIDHVMAELPYDCDVLLAPHHGSRRSDPPGFAAWSTPEWTVVSGSDRTTNQQVTASYEQRGGKLISTSEFGAIEIELRRNHLSVKPYLSL